MERVFDVFQRNVIVTNLSGGMKRKVNLGIALIGGSKVSKKKKIKILPLMTSEFLACQMGQRILVTLVTKKRERDKKFRK